MRIAMIAAMARDRVIGADNQMPWHLPADLKHFKAVTLGKPVVMGRKTFESIGRPLPGRRNIVISRDPGFNAAGIEKAESPEQAMAMAGDCEELMVIGGGAVYQAFLPLAVRLYLTDIELSVEGDTCFPDYQQAADWQLIDEVFRPADSDNPHNMWFRTLERR
ncbi:type 3 dihydrofolate reductase [Aliiglaciecola sp. CAU 1673]|uniref:type 3 dihydrofolate reductase n=1 Tax=Aliiglaciecola sp. CAU 1673 TaxID=3032595 RepID=UPI0023DCBFF2|nr:type 3 dihydrofolate reductase [Aliiglaciecola sp. CAU 1673]MDF2176774.1 type 3 dihydrofolate reductase [Aliiglaciecola sp. CAU 1673]